MSLDRTVKWIDKTQGRDKFCKAIQYSCRFLKHRFQLQGNKQAQKKFQSLFTNMRDARKLFRLFKSLNEAKKIKDLLNQKLNTDVNFNIVIRSFFLLYWFFDNLNILSKLKLLNFDAKKMGKYGSICWFIGLITNLILLIKTLLANMAKTKQIKGKFISSSSEPQLKEKKQQYQKLLKGRTGIFINIVKVLGDVIPAGQGAQIFQRIFGAKASDSICGLGGLVAALITSYQLYD